VLVDVGGRKRKKAGSKQGRHLCCAQTLCIGQGKKKKKVMCGQRSHDALVESVNSFTNLI
jgi:hypothetical protein